MEINIKFNLDEYLEDRDWKEAIMQGISDGMDKLFQYEDYAKTLVQATVREYIDSEIPDFREKLKLQVEEIMNSTDYTQHIFTRDDHTGLPKSYASKVVDKVATKHERIIREKIMEALRNYKVDDSLIITHIEKIMQNTIGNLQDISTALKPNSKELNNE